ncbi:hypothetical protein ACFL17_10195 [Pseudomonadota bacterium]
MANQIKPTLFIVRTANLGMRAPSRRLLREGFDRPRMVTTALVSIRQYHRRISRTEFGKALQEGNVIAYEKDYGGYHGILKPEFQQCLELSSRGVLVVGSPKLASQVKRNRPEALVVVLQNSGADLSHYLHDLEDINHHIIKVNSLAVGESRRVYDELSSLLSSV